MIRPGSPSRATLQIMAETLAGLAAACDRHADRREHALAQPEFRGRPDHARKVIADLRRRAAYARADLATAVARIEALKSDCGPIVALTFSTHMELP